MRILVLLMIILASVNAQAENLKYKRTDNDNMGMHMKCYYIASIAELNFDRKKLHLNSAYDYMWKVWMEMTKEDMDKYHDHIDFYNQESKYYNGYIDGLLADSKNENEYANELYLAICQEDELEFAKDN